MPKKKLSCIQKTQERTHYAMIALHSPSLLSTPRPPTANYPGPKSSLVSSLTWTTAQTIGEGGVGGYRREGGTPTPRCGGEELAFLVNVKPGLDFRGQVYLEALRMDPTNSFKPSVKPPQVRWSVSSLGFEYSERYLHASLAELALSSSAGLFQDSSDIERCFLEREQSHVYYDKLPHDEVQEGDSWWDESASLALAK
jgi:hypothetical protein